MGLMKGWNDPDRLARAQLEAAERESERKFSADPGRPRRYKLYDRIAGKVSERTMNIVIGVTAALLVAAIVIGIITGTPR